MKPVVIYHRADFDGKFCCEIARMKFGEAAHYVGWDYGDPTPQVPDDVPLFILDLSVPGLMAHPRLVWIDHHKSAMDTYEAAAPAARIAGLRIDGVAACRLTWQWFFGKVDHLKSDYVNREVLEPMAVRLAGEFDIWDKRDPRAELLQHGLRSRDLTQDWQALLCLGPEGSLVVHELLTAGKALEYARHRESESIVKSHGFTVQFEGLTFLALNIPRCNSLTFASGLKPEHDGCLAFAWNGRRWRFSLYGVPGKPDIDFSKIAVKHGGGGHRQACGFELPSLPFALGH